MKYSYILNVKKSRDAHVRDEVEAGTTFKCVVICRGMEEGNEEEGAHHDLMLPPLPLFSSCLSHFSPGGSAGLSHLR